MNEPRKRQDILIQVLKETWKQMMDAHLFIVASSLAYTTILSIIPALAVSFAVFKAFGGLEKLSETVEPFIISNLAENVGTEVVGKIHDFIKNANTGTLGLGGLVFLISTTMSMLSSIENSINRIWKTTTGRTKFQRFAYYWVFVTLGPIALA